MKHAFCLLLSFVAALCCFLSPVSAQGGSGKTSAKQSRAAAAGSIKIDSIAFDKEDIAQVLEILQEKTQQEGKPLRFTYDAGEDATAPAPRVGQMVLRKVTVAECLEVCCRMTRSDYAVRKNTVKVFPFGSGEPKHFPKGEEEMDDSGRDSLSDGDTAAERKKRNKAQKKQRKERKKRRKL